MAENNYSDRTPDLVVYKRGELVIKTDVANNRCKYTGEPVENFLNNDYELLPYEKVVKLIRDAVNNDVVDSEWKEITEEQYIDALEILPPQNWRNCCGIEFFQMMELTIYNITAHYAHHKCQDRYFTAQKPITKSYTDYAEELVKQLIADAEKENDNG